MADMLVELIEKFIGGAEATLNSLFNSMLNLVFFIERELSSIKVADGSYINFNSIYQTIFNYAVFLLVIVYAYLGIHTHQDSVFVSGFTTLIFAQICFS